MRQPLTAESLVDRQPFDEFAAEHAGSTDDENAHKPDSRARLPSPVALGPTRLGRSVTWLPPGRRGSGEDRFGRRRSTTVANTVYAGCLIRWRFRADEGTRTLDLLHGQNDRRRDYA